MRLTELCLERYGCYLKRSLWLPDNAGLIVVYGRNEAGKSTCLSALADFFYGIPKNSVRGSTFGYDGMKIGASMRLSDGRELTFLRRKGNGKTLADMKGQTFDDAVLAPVLGSIARDRFSNLFGLDHHTLRSGGDRLLSTDGDIGRLIVEAGGGLRALVGRLKKVDGEASQMFGKTKQSRAFYQGKTAYDTADKEVRAHQVSRDAYEEKRKEAEAALRVRTSLREEQQTLQAIAPRLERILRVAPDLRERDQLVEEAKAFADTAGYPDGFSKSVRDAQKANDAAAEELRKAIDRREGLKARIDALGVPPGLSAAERFVKDLSERAVHVKKARGDRSNREKEIETNEVKLAGLRRMLGLPAGSDLAGKLPDPAATERVQSLAAEAIERKSALNDAEQRVTELSEGLREIEGRIVSAKEAGFDQPLGVASGQFSTLAAEKVNIEARQRKADEEARGIQSELAMLGDECVERLKGLCCPTPDQVCAEQTARDAIKDMRAEQERMKREAEADIKARMGEIAELEAGGLVATLPVIAEAREKRGIAWLPIRTAFVDGRVEGSGESRRAAAEEFEKGVEESDVLSDRRADEAGRVASLHEIERGLARARGKGEAADQELTALLAQLAERETAFSSTYLEVCSRLPALGALLDFSKRREDLLKRAEAARLVDAQLKEDAAALRPIIDRFEDAESKLRLVACGRIAVRVQALDASILRHGGKRADFARDVTDQQKAASDLRTARLKWDRLREEQQKWDEVWPGAIKALGLSATTSPRDANKLATEWIRAEGILEAISQTKHRLERMDQDEAQLKSDVARQASELGIEVGEDPVAAAQMLQKRWDDNEKVRAGRDELKPDYEEAVVAAGRSRTAVKVAEEAMVRLAGAIGVEPDGLAQAAGRYDARVGLEVRIASAEQSARKGGDQLPISVLREEWGERDLDGLRAELAGKRARLAQIGDELEVAISNEQTHRRALEAFANKKEVNRAVVQRESAVTDMHNALERYLELHLASLAVNEAMAEVRADQQDPLVARASALFAEMTQGEFVGIETDVGENGAPVVVGKRGSGGRASIADMSDGTRDQLFLAFRLASLESYGESAEPLPFIADDILVHFDDPRTTATLELMAAFAKRNQVLLFTHHESVRDAATELVKDGRASIVELARAA